MEWQPIIDRREMDTIQKVITDSVEGGLALQCPVKGDGLAILRASQGCKGFDDLAISAFLHNRDVIFGLHKDAKDMA